jgi:hypothetical protein
MPRPHPERPLYLRSYRPRSVGSKLLDLRADPLGGSTAEVDHVSGRDGRIALFMRHGRGVITVGDSKGTARTDIVESAGKSAADTGQ